MYSNRMEKSAQSNERMNHPKVTYAKYQKFPEQIKQTVKKKSHGIKKILATLAVLGFAFFSSSHEKQNTSITINLLNNVEVQKLVIKNNVHDIVDVKTEHLQNQIISNVDSLQRLIIQAQKKGSAIKNKVVKKILDDVFPRGGLPATTNYCVAGATKARMMCQDSTLNGIMPDPNKLPREYGYASSPNVSCPFMRAYFRETLGDNYCEKGDENFSEFVKSLEAGDIITIRSSRNTSSGEHCLTVSGPMQENGRIPVMSLNTEKNYDVSTKQIVSAAKIIEQYRQNLSNSLMHYYEQSYQNFESRNCIADGMYEKPPADTNLAIFFSCFGKGKSI